MTNTPSGIKAHRAAVVSGLLSNQRLFRDTASIPTPWGSIASRAIYRRDDIFGWRMIVDEFGDPTPLGLELYSDFLPPADGTTVVRITNKNQLLISPDGPHQLTPVEWTTRFHELSSLYDFFRRFPQRSYEATASVATNLFEMALGADKWSDTVQRLGTMRRAVGGLVDDLQALLLVCDSDLGKDERPFLQLNGFSPATLNRFSEYRSWSDASALSDIVALTVPPAAHRGRDIYQRPIWGATATARLRHLCVQEMSLLDVPPPNVYRVNYLRLWQTLVEKIEAARADRDSTCRLAGGVARPALLDETLCRMAFWLRFWSHHTRETLIFGNTRPDRVFDLEMDRHNAVASFSRGEVPAWKAPDRISPADFVRNWSLPFCPANDDGGWDHQLTL